MKTRILAVLLTALLLPSVASASFSKGWTVFESAARTAAPTPVEYSNDGAWTYCYFTLDVTAIAATPSITVEMHLFDAASGKYEEVAAMGPSTSVETRTGVMGFTIIQSGDVESMGTQRVPDYFRVRVTHADTDSITYSLGMQCNG